MKTSDFNFDLPQELIAQTPIEKRDASRLLVLDKESGAWEHRHFFDLPEYLHPGDCLILNDSRVLPARLLGQRLPGGGACEVLLLIDRGENTWECLVRPGKHLRQGAKLSFGNGAAFVFGSQITTSGPLVPACLLIRSSPVSRFRSSHWRAAISPSRRPVANSRRNNS